MKGPLKAPIWFRNFKPQIPSKGTSKKPFPTIDIGHEKVTLLPHANPVKGGKG
jgi:hypothetical protein